MTVIIGIKLPDKKSNAVEFQRILTEFNCIIKMRLGINNSSIFCASEGIVLLQIDNNESSVKLEKALLEISGIEMQRMIF
ncbi:MAG: hypothetical protein LUH05_01695 [Candidatus Gastranaerophilales bacterium]|nr:hypothetical protein [Candidatus Gastranaerophilales bacterium]